MQIFLTNFQCNENEGAHKAIPFKCMLEGRYKYPYNQKQFFLIILH